MTKNEFFLDMLQYYAVDPLTRRCIDNGYCTYSPVTSNKVGQSEGCAIGRKLTPDNALTLDKIQKGFGVNSVMAREPELLPEWMKDLGSRFLGDVQNFHDISTNWQAIGLSEKGKIKVRSMVSLYDLDAELFKEYLP